jgi:flagellar hook-associated protein 3 FlgL
MRVSSVQIARNSLYGISTTFSRFDEAQRRVSTGKQLQAPSDDPSGTAQALSFRKDMSDLEQFGRTMDQAKGFMAMSDTALSSVTTLIHQARALAVQGATDSITGETRAALGNQLQNIIRQLGNIGNTTFGTRYVFAGQQTQSPPMMASGNTFNYVGGTMATGDADIVLDIGRGEALKINVTGDKVFTPLLAALGSLRDHVALGQSSLVSREDLAALDAQLSNVLSARAEIGSNIQRIDLTKSRNELTKVNFTQFISNIEDADIPKAIVDMQVAETAYQSALQATSRAFQNSLLDFLR